MNSDSSAALTFGPFPSIPGQHSAEWPAWFALIQSFALNVSTGQEGGLLGFILDPPTYLLDYGHPFVPFAHPGPTPALNAAAGAWSAHGIAIANWRCESNAINSLMANIFKSLDRVAISWFFEPLRNRYNMAPANFFVIMQREYGIADTEQVSKWITMLHDHMPPNSSVRDLVTRHRELHSQINHARGYVMHEDEAIRALIQATKMSPFRLAIIQWLTEHRGQINQVFDVLATHLCQIEVVTDSIASPAVGAMYSPAQANQLDIVNQPEANAMVSNAITNADLLKAIQEMVTAMTKLSRPAGGNTKSTVSSTASPTEFCWTHGVCGHTSATCKRPTPGHVLAATASNPLGGNTSKWVRPK